MEDTVENIEELIREAEAAGEPGSLSHGEVIHRGDEDTPVPMVAARLQSAGYVYIYDTETREPSLCNRNMLSQVLKLEKNGKPAFTTHKPTKPPVRGAFKCLLHPDDPNREHYDQLGFPTCPKANLTSPYQVTRHMQKRHKAEYATIEAERAAKEKQDDRDFQRQMIAAMSNKATPDVYVSDKPKVGRPKK